MPTKIKIEHCTSCGSTNIKVDGNQYYCPDCDKTAKVTEQGTKVIDKNPLGREKARIDKIEDDVAKLKGEKPAEPAEEKGIATEAGDKAESRAASGEDEDESDQDGFITW
ncbi:hypothetical protein ES702_07058 [subsurface metagenome]